ncbi:calcineurin-like phosphoesterase C-terminal domain-containing protein [Solitalea lacus]|uniref:calcineurin-like phosphoesterase C-terminal domain-containing protein n=1 Tax=Solitalea lacus TaxID=2911172 RepID=UPI001EDC2713|nr:calcineurin-like phosphoesterase family protein [Solitalea lacus]UKJ08611.1 calcineurin-like phosphoesterase family protein [Solitalea lacus]
MFRRDFLKNMGLLGAVASLPTVLVNAATTKGSLNDIAAITLKGRVLEQGKGVGGVAVTDGINIVLTDTKGNYQLLSNKTAQFVYISTPSGYKIEHIDWVASFYKPIEKSGAVFNADFNLTKLTKSDHKHQFVVWADPQIQSRSDADQLLNTSAPDLRELVKNYGEDALFHGIGCGDLVFDRFELFADYKKAVAISGIPFFQVLGNHDMDLEGVRSDEQSSATFKQQFGPTYYSFNRGKIHYVVLDDVFFVGAKKKYIGYITENQLSWLEQDLKNVPHGSTVMVALHIPTDSGDKRRNGLMEESMGGVVVNRQQLYNILEPYNVHILSGHTHWNEHVIVNDKLMEHNHGTVCGAWWSGPFCGDGTPNGYGVYEVDGDNVKWYYKSTGKSKDYQLMVHAKGAYKEYADSIMANVWNWDPKWKIEWLEDGVLKGEMQRITGYDPLTVELYQGPAIPAYHKWVEPIKTDHLFIATPSSGAKSITVRATDRFGNVYEQTAQV